MARQARTDPLTGLLNRRAFLDESAAPFDRLEREQLPGTLVFVDLDNFKALNDRCGHDAGDEALCLTAELLRATVRPSRPRGTLRRRRIRAVAGRRRRVHRRRAGREPAPRRTWRTGRFSRCPGPGGLPALGMSIGIATRWPGQGEEIDALIHRADQAMYEVKRAGRGHWRVSRPEAA